MDAITLALMLLAAVLHATWHSLVKSGAERIFILTGMCIVGAIAGACALPFVAVPPNSIWLIIAISIVFHSVYRLSLAQAYAHGDLSQAYPFARGLVPLFATVIAFAFLGQVPVLGQMFGIGAISCGLIGLAWDGLSQRSLLRKLLQAAAGAGLMVACYSVIDAYGTRHADNWASYTAWMIVLDSGSFSVCVWILSGRRLWEALNRQRWRTVISGLLGTTSFAVFLWALSRNPVGPVSALRETSILFATFIGIFIRGEKRSALRLAAAPMIVIGIVAMAILS